MFIRPIYFDAPNDQGGEPQSVADAGRAMAAAGYDADRLAEGTPAPDKGPIVEPTSIADRQRAASEPAPPAAPPAAPAAPAAAAPSPGTPQPTPGAPQRTPQEIADMQAFEEWKANPQAQAEAFNIQRGLTTEQGVRMIVAQGLTALNFQPEDVRAFVEGRLTLSQQQQQQAVAAAAAAPAPVAPANPWDNLTDEDLIDGPQFKQYAAEIQRQAIEQATAAAQAQIAAATAPQNQAIQQERQVRAGQVTDSTLVELLGEGGDVSTVDKELAQRVLQEASKYIDPNNWDSGHIRAAVIMGHHDVVKIAEAAQRAYLNRKSLVAEGVPTSVGGAQAPGAEPMAEPKSLKEASKMAKEMGLLG